MFSFHPYSHMKSLSSMRLFPKFLRRLFPNILQNFDVSIEWIEDIGTSPKHYQNLCSDCNKGTDLQWTIVFEEIVFSFNFKKYFSNAMQIIYQINKMRLCKSWWYWNKRLSLSLSSHLKTLNWQPFRQWNPMFHYLGDVILNEYMFMNRHCWHWL